MLNTQTQLVHAKEVVTTGVCLFARSQERIRVFEMQVLSQYARFLEDRAPVEAASTFNADGWHPAEQSRDHGKVPAHEYQKPNLDILRAIVESRGADFLAFSTALGLRIQV